VSKWFGSKLSSRDRVLCALEHEEPDRVPVFFGTSGVTSMLVPAYERLKAFLGVRHEPRYISQAFQYARIDDEVMERFHSDGRPLLPGPAPSVHRRDISRDEFVDEWGVHWRRAPGSLYFEIVVNPLRNHTLGSLEEYPWPELAHPSRFTGLREEAHLINQAGYAVVAMTGASLFEQVQMLRGMDIWLMDMVENQDFAEALLNKVHALMLAACDAVIAAAGDLIDVILIGDDLGTQTAPIVSPQLYRRMLKPYHASLIANAKAKTKARVFFHSDGNIYPLLGDLVDIGVDIINPVQVSAGDMGDTARLKREYGRYLSFCGAVDTQYVLPHGTAHDVRQEVRRRIRDLGPGGGYIVASVHAIQPDVPPENIAALFDEAVTAGCYPLRL